MEIQSGDILIADTDGIIIIPQAYATTRTYKRPSIWRAFLCKYLIHLIIL